jgi:hypothetical protein
MLLQMENVVKINPKPIQKFKKQQDKKIIKRSQEEPHDSQLRQVNKKQFVDNKKCDPNMCRDLKNCLKDHFI